MKQVGDLQLFTLYYIFTEEESVEFIAWGKMFKVGEERRREERGGTHNPLSGDTPAVHINSHKYAQNIDADYKTLDDNLRPVGC